MRGLWAVLALSMMLASTALADDAPLRARLAALGTIAESETDLASAARAALDRSVTDRTRGDEAASARAEHIAEASIALIERRRARADAQVRLRAAQAEQRAMQQRLDDARAAAASDAAERARLAPGPTP
jgi:hypothetical protein